jgi:hypothetical protein
MDFLGIRLKWNDSLLADVSLLISPVDINQHFLIGKTRKTLYKKRDLVGFNVIRVDRAIK